MKKGFTLVELLVASGIFLIVITLSVGAFITVSNVKVLGIRMKNSQQKVRIALEMIGRLSKQADEVIVSTDKKRITLINNGDDTSQDVSGSEFLINTAAGKDMGLYYFECYTVDQCDVLKTNTSPTNGTNLFGGDFKLNNTSQFAEDYSQGFPFLGVTINGASSNGTTNPYYNDSLNITTSIQLRNPL